MVTVAIILWTVVAATAVFWVYASLIEPRSLRVRHLDIPVPDLPEELAGLRIAHLSDLHCSANATAGQMSRRAVAATLREAPDLVMITGDMADGSHNMAYAVDRLARLRAEYGVYAVLGNHDWDCTLGAYLYGTPNPPVALGQWEEALSNAGVDLLENASRTLTINGRTVTIVGIGDPSCGRDHLDAALANSAPADLKILLAHSPDAIDLPGAQWADLLLAGHTHGGQCRLPGWGSVWAPVWRLRQRSDGLLRFGDNTVAYISRGVYAGTEARFLCPPEVTILVLRPGSIQPIPVTRRFTAQANRSATADERHTHAAVE